MCKYFDTIIVKYLNSHKKYNGSKMKELKFETSNKNIIKQLLGQNGLLKIIMLNSRKKNRK